MDVDLMDRTLQNQANLIDRIIQYTEDVEAICKDMRKDLGEFERIISEGE